MQILILAVLLLAPGLEGFDYQNPDEWRKESEVCNGQKQSPINLELSAVGEVISTNRLQWNGYGNVPDTMTIQNDGHTIQLNPKWVNKDDVPYLEGGPLNGKYALLQIHFHWGPTNDVGSEHTVEGNAFPLECHMVHKKVDYDAVSDALKQVDGLAVVGSFYEVESDEDAADIFDTLKDLIPRVADSEGEKNIDPFPMDIFDVVNVDTPILSYAGSLTTPGCNEVVTWIVSTAPYTATDDSMASFRSVKLEQGDTSNFRPVQPRNDREITLYF